MLLEVIVKQNKRQMAITFSDIVEKLRQAAETVVDYDMSRCYNLLECTQHDCSPAISGLASVSRLLLEGFRVVYFYELDAVTNANLESRQSMDRLDFSHRRDTIDGVSIAVYNCSYVCKLGTDLLQPVGQIFLCG